MIRAADLRSWVKVQLLLFALVVGLLGLEFAWEVGSALAETYSGGLDTVAPYLVGLWALVLAVSAWYAGRIGEE